MYCYVAPLRKAKFCGVPSRPIVKFGCAVRKKQIAKHWDRRLARPRSKPRYADKLTWILGQDARKWIGFKFGFYCELAC
jgi:hypothetical protein